jgi:hypothetical protein
MPKSIKNVVIILLSYLVLYRLACNCGATPQRTNAALDIATTRTIAFPADISLGALDVCERRHLDNSLELSQAPSTQHMGTARGTVHITVPPAHLLKLTLNHNCFSQPQLLDTIPVDALDAITVHFSSMEDSEDHLCDAALTHIARFTNLKYLSLDRSETTDIGLSNIRSMTKLRQLTAAATSINGTAFSSLEI